MFIVGKSVLFNMEQKEQDNSDLKNLLLKINALPEEKRIEASQKMKETGAFFIAFSENILAADDIRVFSIYSHQLLDIIVNNYLSQKFAKPDGIFDFSFSQKLTILDAFGFFDGHKTLYSNIKIINKVRNIYSHNWDMSLGKDIPPNVKKSVDSMQEFGNTFTEKSDTFQRFKKLCINTIQKMHELTEYIPS